MVDDATSSASMFHSASRKAVWNEPGPLDAAAARSPARLNSSEAANAATSGSDTHSYVATTPPKAQPAPVILVIIGSPPGRR